jgi:S-adenosylmethionine-diacylglycerol 3-amino-3-carboxypropyl transferase
MSKELTEKALFNFIRYANCWEDAEILLQGLAPKPGSRILSVASAGDNSLSLLTTNPELVIAVDISEVQLWLVELKKAAFQHLSYEEMLGFLGFAQSTERERIFNGLKQSLSNECRNYFETNIHLIKAGIVSQGKFEKYFQLFSKKVLPFIHSDKTIDQLIAIKTEDEQRLFYTEYWNTWRWRLLFKLFFSKYIMGRFGRDPEFLKEVEVHVGKAIFLQAEKHLQTIPAQGNWMLHYQLKGEFGNKLPHYVQPENFTIIQSNLNRLQLKKGYAEEIAKQYRKFDCMNLSNIFEYMNNNMFAITAHQLIDATKKGGKLVYWNLMVPRFVSLQYPQKAAYCKDQSSQLSLQDKGFFYRQFIIDEII